MPNDRPPDKLTPDVPHLDTTPRHDAISRHDTTPHHNVPHYDATPHHNVPYYDVPRHDTTPHHNVPTSTQYVPTSTQSISVRTITIKADDVFPRRAQLWNVWSRQRWRKEVAMARAKYKRKDKKVNPVDTALKDGVKTWWGTCGAYCGRGGAWSWESCSSRISIDA